MSAGVITANMAWKSMKLECGMVADSEASGASPTPASPSQESPPMNLSRPPPGEKARL